MTRKTFLVGVLALGMLSWRAWGGLFLPTIQQGNIQIQLQTVATQMAAPDYAISPPGDASRLFVVEQNGLLRLVQNGQLVGPSSLDISSRLFSNPTSATDERGFLGLAFHPGYNNPTSPGFRTLYTYSSEPVPVGTNPTYVVPNLTATPPSVQNFKMVVAEWKISAGDANTVDPTSRREIFSFGKQANNHNGGTIAFGPDGYLYLATGDGGNANDVGPSHIEPGGNAQNLTTVMGKMLRIDPLSPALTSGSADPVSGNGQYRIPENNPFRATAGAAPEIYAYGLRNPYRFAFDRANGQLILADVGQNQIEEINRIEIGRNYGWAMKEGTFRFDRATGIGPAPGINEPGVPAGLTDPIQGTQGFLQYDHGDGISITGGFVYRGTAIPELIGKYVFGDLALNTPPRVDGRLFYADLTTGEINYFPLPPEFSPLGRGILPDGLTIHGFGEDALGELYVLATNTPANGTGGIIYKLAPIPEPGAVMLIALGSLALIRRRSR